MIYRLADKLLISALSVGFFFLLFQVGEGESASAYPDRSLVNTVFIGVILGCLIISTATEALRSALASMAFMAVGLVLSFFLPEANVLLGATSYSLFSDTTMENVFMNYHDENRTRMAFQNLLSQWKLWIRILLVSVGVVSICIAKKYLLIILVLVAAILSVKTTCMSVHDKLVTEKYDKVRYDARRSKELKEEISHSIDMQVQNATLAERNRIAREIHDNVGHMLTRAVVQLQAISVINQDEQTKPYIESVSATVNEAMTNIRRSVHELHDDSIDLSIGIHEVATLLKDKFEVDVSTSIESPVPNTIKNAILGIIKEGVTNIEKHSNGKKVRLEVVENHTFWRVLVQDDGKCDPIELSRSSDFAALGGEHGIGLSNIFSRAQSCGGRATIQGGAEGFKVTVTIPKN